MNDENKVILIISLLAFISCFTVESVTIALPEMTTQLHISPVMVNWISIAAFMFAVAFELPCGKILTRYGVITCLKRGLLLLLLSIFITILTDNPYIIILGRLLSGSVIAIMAISIYLLISNQIPKKDLGRALGIGGLASAISVLLAPLIGGILITYTNWRVLLGFPILFIIPLIILLYGFNKEWCNSKVDVDIVGSLLFLLNIVLVIYGLSFLNTYLGVISFILGLVLFVIFLYYETKAKNPIYDFNLLKNKNYVINNYVALAHRLAKSGICIVIISYLQYIRGLSAASTSIYIALIALMMLIFSPLSGKLSDSYDAIRLSKIGLICMIISSLGLCFINNLSNTLIMLFLIILGIGVGLVESPNRKVVLYDIKEEQLGSASSFLSTMRDMGDTIGIALFTLIIGIFSETTDSWVFSSQVTIMIITFVLFSSLALFYANKYYKVIYKFDLPKLFDLGYLK